MAISDKTRKVLWARSGNRCALCKCILTLHAISDDSRSVVGDECHIVAQSHRGPRGVVARRDLDDYENLVLLCKNDHKLIDDQPKYFTVDVLRAIKAAHEIWVHATLTAAAKEKGIESAQTPQREIWPLPRIESGGQLVSMLRGALMYNFGNDRLKTPEEVSRVPDFLGLLQDYGDCIRDLDVGDVVRIEAQFDNELREFEESGFLIFGELSKGKLQVAKEFENFSIFSAFVLRTSTGAAFQRKDGSIMVIPKIECIEKEQANEVSA